jgi:hypothetical protein
LLHTNKGSKKLDCGDFCIFTKQDKKKKNMKQVCKIKEHKLVVVRILRRKECGKAQESCKSSNNKKRGKDCIVVCTSMQSCCDQDDNGRESCDLNLHPQIHYCALEEEATMAGGTLAHQGSILAMARKEWEQRGNLK